MNKTAVMKFIALVEVHFPRPKFSGDEAKETLWLRSMAEILGEFEPDVLMKAAEKIVRTRNPQTESSMFPKPSECIAACHAVQKVELSAEVMAAFKAAAKPVPQIGAALPMYEITPADIAWEAWMSHFRAMGRHDIVGEAEGKCRVRASKRWPSSDAVVFEPKLENAPSLLASLPPPKQMPN